MATDKYREERKAMGGRHGLLSQWYREYDCAMRLGVLRDDAVRIANKIVPEVLKMRQRAQRTDHNVIDPGA